MILILTLLPNQEQSQIFTHMYATLFVMIYLVERQPYVNRKITYQEFINETVVLFASYPLLVFTPWLWNTNRRIEAGWTIVATIVFIILFNMCLVILQVIWGLYRKYKFWFIRKQRIREYQEKHRWRFDLHKRHIHLESVYGMN